MTAAMADLREAVGRHRRLFLAIMFGLPLAYFVLMLTSLIVKFGVLPNYFELYNWPVSVGEIIRSTPSVSDMLPIIADEWLLEVGYMNYDYGAGISEWSMSIIPWKTVVMLVLGALLAANVVLLLPSERTCRVAAARGAGTASGVGAALVSVTSITMTWVVCCATPSWIVGLAMLGVSVSTAAWLEVFGPWLGGAGFAMLVVSLVLLLRQRRWAPPEPMKHVSNSPALTA